MTTDEPAGPGEAGPPDLPRGGSADAPPAGPRSRISHDGEFGEIFVLFLVNLLLSILTLGVYRFWGKTRIRRYVWSRTSLHGDSLEYTGTGKELFLGFLVALVFLVPLYGAYNVVEYLYPEDLELQTGLGFGLGVAFFFLYGVAVYSAYRYQMSRTQWRGIRGAVAGSRWGYGLRRFGFIVLSSLTLGFFSPFADVHLWAYRLRHTSFGDRPFRFAGDGGVLLPTYALCWLLYLPTLSLSMMWYRAARLRYLLGQTRYENLSFATRISGRQLLGFQLGNLALIVLTLGFAWPQVVLRTARMISAHLEIAGEQDFEEIAQSQAARPATGEGLAEFLDVGGI